jgi:predicted solute-binding protein
MIPHRIILPAKNTTAYTLTMRFFTSKGKELPTLAVDSTVLDQQKDRGAFLSEQILLHKKSLEQLCSLEKFEIITNE